MSAKKPLIFVHPLSDTLKQLKEVIQDIAEEEKIEIYEAEDTSEAVQLLPTIGQSLAIFSHPKKCAMTLQPTRKVLSKLNTKVILLSKKSMPRKTLDKFSKIGLTECIVEPVAPKTLLYKVKLLLRSIVLQKMDEEDEDVKFSEKSEWGSTDDEEQRLEKGVIAGEIEGSDSLDGKLKGKIADGFDIDAEEENEKKRQGYIEEALEKNWRGNSQDDTLDLEDDTDKKKRDANDEGENYIDSYLRSKKKGTEVEFDDFEEERNRTSHDDEGYTEEELQRRKEQGLDLDIESSSANRSNDKSDDVIDQYMRGKTSQEMNIDLDADENTNQQQDEDIDLYDEDDDQHRRTSNDLNLEAEEKTSKDHEDESMDEDDFDNKRKSEMTLDLDADDDGDKNLDEDDNFFEDEEEKSRKKAQGLEIEEDTEKKKNGFENHLNLEDDSDHDDDNEEHEDIDKYMRGKLASQNALDLEAEEVDARNKLSIEGSLVDEDESEGEEELLDLEADEQNTRQETNLDLEDDDENARAKKNDETLNLEEDEDENTRKNDINIDLDASASEYSDEEDTDEFEDEDEARRRSSSELDLDASEEDDYATEEDDEVDDDYGTGKKGLNLDLDDDLEQKKFDGHTEHIQTHMDSRKGLKHQEYDWDIVNKKNELEGYEKEKKVKSDIQISFAEKQDLGEQTIDYRKLHSEFDAITINREGNRRKRTGPKYVSDDSDSGILNPNFYADEYDEALENITSKKNQEDVDEEIIVYEPNTQGLDIAIKVMNLYMNRHIKKEDIFNYISSTILENYAGHSFFFIFNKGTNKFELSSSLNEDQPDVDTTILSDFKDFSESNMNIWLELNLPTWSDITFQSSENYFFYPIYEGALKLGFIIIQFSNKAQEKQAKSIEVILETTRGIVLDEFHQSATSGEYNDIKTEEKSKPVGIIKSLFGKLFGKKAA